MKQWWRWRLLYQIAKQDENTQCEPLFKEPQSHTHTHTHTHTTMHTHIYIYTAAPRVFLSRGGPKNMLTKTPPQVTHTHKHTFSHSLTHTHKHTLSHSLTHTHKRTNTHTHWNVYLGGSKKLKRTRQERRMNGARGPCAFLQCHPAKYSHMPQDHPTPHQASGDTGGPLVTVDE